MTDEEVVARVIQGERQLFAVLVDRYKQALFNYIMKTVYEAEDAADLAQETFLRAYKSLPKYRGQASVKNWLYRIAHNICLDHLRKQKVSKNKFWGALVPSFQSQPPKESPEDILVAEEQCESIRWALERLSPIYKQVIVLYHFQECSYEEIAAILEVPKRTVETRLYRARGKLKSILKGGKKAHELPDSAKQTAAVSNQAIIRKG